VAANSTPVSNISGLASGLDTNSIVTQLMQIERQPQTRMKQQQVVYTARQQALKDINTRLSNLQTAIAAPRDPGTWSDRQTVDSNTPSQIGVLRTGGAPPGGYDVVVSRLARAHQMSQATNAGPATQDGVLELSLGTGDPVEVQVNAGDTADTIAARINQTQGSQVYAGVVDGKLVLSGKQTGQSNTIAVTGTAAAQFGFAETQSARDALFTVDGVQHSSASNVVANGIVGVTLTLKAVTSGAVSVVVGTPTADSDAIKNSVQGFVDQYNSTLGFILGKMNEKPVVNPATDADRIKGVLYNDPTLRNLVSSMRSTVAASNDSTTSIASLLQIGVSTGAAASGGTPNPDALAGKLTLDTTALTNAITNDFARTKAQFTTVSTDPTVPAAVGKLDTLVTRFGNGANGLLKGQIDSQQTQIDSLRRQSDAMDLRLKTKEATLRARFTAMETALSRSQSVGNAIASQISQLTSGSS
jgi:flagellar hook-associated protein 2